MTINLDTLREMRNSAAAMAAYYRGRIADKLAQNAALVAAGLKPLHSERDIQWDVDGIAKNERFVAALDAVIAYFGEQAEAA